MKKDGDVCFVAPGSPRCWGISSADTAPVLVSLGASVRLVSARGERVIPVHELFRDDGMHPYTIAADEILSEVILPPAAGWQSIYLKLRRRGSFDFPILGVAVALLTASDRSVADAPITLGAVASHPVDARDAAALVTANQLTSDAINAAAATAAKP